MQTGFLDRLKMSVDFVYELTFSSFAEAQLGKQFMVKHFIDILLVISGYFCYNSQRSFMNKFEGSNRRGIMANKLSEQIYGSILKDIVSGVYAAGIYQ